jgi:hypothetical protein
MTEEEEKEQKIDEYEEWVYEQILYENEG